MKLEHTLTPYTKINFGQNIKNYLKVKESDQKYTETWGELILVRRDSYFQQFFNLGQAPGSATKSH